MDDRHEITFEWPHSEPSTVIVTGTFDQWSSSITLTKEGAGFKATTRIPWEEKIAYKFIVDGNWTTTPSQPTETDASGNVNNVYTAPSKP
ncbi:carbohydrate-binding module family 48 protein, partial [Hymenopellis radicata]